MEYIVETDNLVKIYGLHKVVDNVSIHVGRGEIYGLIGKNGAGKTTLMRLILGLAEKTSGNIYLYGKNENEAPRNKIGALVESPALYKNETAFENMKRVAILTPTSDEKLKALLSVVKLDDTDKKKVKDFSLGMKQRLGIAMALVGDPDLLVLDEPINGLDPAGIKEMRDLILTLNEKGVTFIISSHLLDELGKIATTYGIINHGRIEEISAEELKQKCKKHIRIVVDDTKKAKQIIESMDKNYDVEIVHNEIIIDNEIEDSSKINAKLVTSGINVLEVDVVSMGLEDYFIATEVCRT